MEKFGQRRGPTSVRHRHVTGRRVLHPMILPFYFNLSLTTLTSQHIDIHFLLQFQLLLLFFLSWNTGEESMPASAPPSLYNACVRVRPSTTSVRPSFLCSFLPRNRLNCQNSGVSPDWTRLDWTYSEMRWTTRRQEIAYGGFKWRRTRSEEVKREERGKVPREMITMITTQKGTKEVHLGWSPQLHDAKTMTSSVIVRFLC